MYEYGEILCICVSGVCTCMYICRMFTYVSSAHMCNGACPPMHGGGPRIDIRGLPQSLFTLQTLAMGALAEPWSHQWGARQTSSLWGFLESASWVVGLQAGHHGLLALKWVLGIETCKASSLPSRPPPSPFHGDISAHANLPPCPPGTRFFTGVFSFFLFWCILENPFLH